MDFYGNDDESYYRHLHSFHYIFFSFIVSFVWAFFSFFFALMKSVPLIQLSKAEYSERNIGENGKLQPNNFHFYTANRLCHFGNCWRNFFPSYYFHFFLFCIHFYLRFFSSSVPEVKVIELTNDYIFIQKKI